MVDRVRFTQEQLTAYFDRVSLPPDARIFDVTNLSDNDKLDYLVRLTKHQLVHVPWENLSLHYSWHGQIDVRPNVLLRKVTARSGRGGYCFETNHLIYTVLYSVNFDVYMAGSRVNLGIERGYTGFEHIVNIVTIGQKRYLQDCGFGTRGPISAMLLEEGTVTSHIASAQSKLRHDRISINVSSQKVWILDYRPNPDADFMAVYCFVDVEFTPRDIIGLNLKPSLDRRSWFTSTVVAVRYTMEGEDPETDEIGSQRGSELHINGVVSLFKNTLRWWCDGKLVVEQTHANEEERIQALAKYFHIFLDDDERSCITGSAAMLISSGT